MGCVGKIQVASRAVSLGSGTSQYVGVCRRGDKWVSGITASGKHYCAGTFDDEVEAAKARDRIAYSLHGERAYLNFPEDFPPGCPRDPNPPIARRLPAGRRRCRKRADSQVGQES